MSKLHVMLDIETMGTEPGCVVASIGAVSFDADGIEGHFFSVPQWEGTMSHDTVKWWLNQSQQARNEILRESTGTIAESISKFLSFVGDKPIWGNGVDFDNAILQYHARQNGIKWPYRSNRCYRTIKNLFPVEYIKPTVAHDALADAEAQALTLINIDKKYNLGLFK